jgi:hypothetical protein
VEGRRPIVDRDAAALHNTNRTLGMPPRDARWSDGQPAHKAVLAADPVGAEPHVCWYDEWLDRQPPPVDLILPLANERDVRHDIGQRREPVLLHATLSPTWEAQLHRHVASLDECIDRRFAAHRHAPAFACSSDVDPRPAGPGTPSSTDAALPCPSSPPPPGRCSPQPSTACSTKAVSTVRRTSGHGRRWRAAGPAHVRQALCARVRQRAVTSGGRPVERSAKVEQPDHDPPTVASAGSVASRSLMVSFCARQPQ